jgi:5-amino-6-(5-phospho-D-ribitylamino)uracil phosphatase
MMDEMTDPTQIAPADSSAPAAPTPSESTDAIRLLALDLDGTLLTSDKQISPPTLAALASVRDAGIKVVIASARPPRSVRHLFEQLALDTLQINYNGALIWDEPAKRPVFHRPLSSRLARAIVELSRDQYPEVLVTCEVMDRWLTDRDDHTHTTETGRMFKPDLVAPLETYLDKPVTKLMLLSDPPIIARLEAILIERFANVVAIIRTDDDLIQLMDRRVSKAVALQKLAAHYGINPRQIMAIGDAPNDVGMLQLAGVAVAMDNAYDVVKKVADWIAPSNNDDGVLAALQHYGLTR